VHELREIEIYFDISNSFFFCFRASLSGDERLSFYVKRCLPWHSLFGLREKSANDKRLFIFEDNNFREPTVKQKKKRIAIL